MVSPDDMIQRVNPEDFYVFPIEDVVVYIQKDFIDAQDDIEFLIPYCGKEKITLLT